jgi:hypothetical protein
MGKDDDHWQEWRANRVPRDHTQKRVPFRPPPSIGASIKILIRTAIIENPDVTLDDLMKDIESEWGGSKVSRLTVANIRAEFRQSLKFLNERGLLKGVSI